MQKDPVVPDGPDWFRDVTATSGIDFTYRNGEEADLYTILESVGGGVAMIDYDGDGLLDLFFTGGGSFDGKQIKGHPCKLYKNLGNWKFHDVTAEVGPRQDRLLHPRRRGRATTTATAGPTCSSPATAQVALFHNEPQGQRHYATRPTKAGTPGRRLWSTSAALGRPHRQRLSRSVRLPLRRLVVQRTTPSARARVPTSSATCARRSGSSRCQHALFRNNGNGTFRDITSGADAAQRRQRAGRRPGRRQRRRQAGHLRRQRCDQQFPLLQPRRRQARGERARSPASRVDDHGMYNGSMGVDVGRLRRQRPARRSSSPTSRAKSTPSTSTWARSASPTNRRPPGSPPWAGTYVGFGTALRRRGQRRLGGPGHRQRPRPAQAARQHAASRSRCCCATSSAQGRRIFQDYSRHGGPFFATPAVGRGIAVGDLDNDGWPDLVVSNTNSPVVLLRNEAVDRQTAPLARRQAGRPRPPRHRRHDAGARGGFAKADALRQGRRQLSCRPAIVASSSALVRREQFKRLTREVVLGQGADLGQPRTPAATGNCAKEKRRPRRCGNGRGEDQEGDYLPSAKGR